MVCMEQPKFMWESKTYNGFSKENLHSTSHIQSTELTSPEPLSDNDQDRGEQNKLNTLHAGLQSANGYAGYVHLNTTLHSPVFILDYQQPRCYFVHLCTHPQRPATLCHLVHPCTPVNCISAPSSAFQHSSVATCNLIPPCVPALTV